MVAGSVEPYSARQTRRAVNVKELLAQGRAQLENQPVGQLEAGILLCEVLGVNRAWLYANPEQIPA